MGAFPQSGFALFSLCDASVAGTFWMYDRREHAGGKPLAEQTHGEWHPLVPFDYDAVEEPEEDPTRYTIDQVGEALSEIVRWLINDGRAQRRGIYNRAIALAFIIQPNFVGIFTQVMLAKRLKLSEAQTSAIVKSFVERFGFMAAHLRGRSKETCKEHNRQSKGGKGCTCGAGPT